jgi:hypothetical protein
MSKLTTGSGAAGAGAAGGAAFTGPLVAVGGVGISTSPEARLVPADEQEDDEAAADDADTGTVNPEKN